MCIIYRSAFAPVQTYVWLLNVGYKLSQLFVGLDRHSEHYAQLSLRRDRRLSIALENILRDVILADPSDYGIDLAVARIFQRYRPGTRKWELQYLEGCWLVCEPRVAEDKCIRRVHVNLHNGLLVVDDQPWCNLPYGIRNHPGFEKLFYDVRTCTVSDIDTVPNHCLQPAFNVMKFDLPEMDSATLVMSSEHKVAIWTMYQDQDCSRSYRAAFPCELMTLYFEHKAIKKPTFSSWSLRKYCGKTFRQCSSMGTFIG